MTSIREEIKRLSALAAPVVLTQLSTMLLGVVDALMVGRVGPEALGAAALGNVWVMGTLLAGMGLVLGIDPLVSQAHGAGDARRLGLALQQGISVALLVSIPISVALLFTERGLLALGQSPAIAAEAHRYALVQIPSVPAFLVFMALRQYLQGRTIVMPAMWVAFAANGLNALANWVLIFGYLGLPALGVFGSGIATTLTRWFMLVALFGWIATRRLHVGAWEGWSREGLSARGTREVLRYGVPVALYFSLEVWAFQASTLLAGRLGDMALAAHTIVLNIASLSFMVPLGISIGAATRVGNLIGAGDAPGAQRAAWVAMGMGAGVMGAFALTFAFGRKLLPVAYTDNVEVIAMAALILPAAAAFQLFDGVQVVGGGVLRGMGRTVPVAVFNLLGYYALALPLGYVAAFRLDMGVVGIWWGLCLGLAFVALTLFAWVAVRGPGRVDARVV